MHRITTSVPVESIDLRAALKTVDYFDRLAFKTEGAIEYVNWDACAEAWFVIGDLAPGLYATFNMLMQADEVIKGYETWSNWFGLQMVDPLGY